VRQRHSYPIIVTHLSFNFLCLLLLYSIYLNALYPLLRTQKYCTFSLEQLLKLSRGSNLFCNYGSREWGPFLSLNLSPLLISAKQFLAMQLMYIISIVNLLKLPQLLHLCQVSSQARPVTARSSFLVCLEKRCSAHCLLNVVAQSKGRGEQGKTL
jgi:hypothetical protein